MTLKQTLQAGLDNVAPKLADWLASWFGVLGPYTVYTRVPVSDMEYVEFAYGAFTEKQALRLLAEFGAHGGSVHKWGKCLAVRCGSDHRTE